MREKILFILLGLTMACGSGCAPLEKSRDATSWKRLKWQHVNRQTYDYSCGAGALSTLIEYYFRDPAPEPFILGDMLRRIQPETLPTRLDRGFSMQDLKIQAQNMGYLAAGVKLSPEQLEQLKGPVIVLLEGKEVNHFAIVKGIAQGRVYLADPSRGNIWLWHDDFTSQWKSGLALVLGKKGFGLPADHLLALEQELAPEWSAPRAGMLGEQYRQFQNMPDKFSRIIFPVKTLN